jgi:penicillin-insensitive murein endopeptidase
VRLPADREAIEPPSLVRPDGRAVDPTRWRPAHITLLRLAAALPNVDRILVNPAIKQQLCREAGADRAWLHLIRPWWGHSSHMHLRLRCPAGQPDCPQAPPPPPGDGCDATLDWWFAQLDRPPSPPTPPKPPVILAACRPILGLPR